MVLTWPPGSGITVIYHEGEWEAVGKVSIVQVHQQEHPIGLGKKLVQALPRGHHSQHCHRSGQAAFWLDQGSWSGAGWVSWSESALYLSPVWVKELYFCSSDLTDTLSSSPIPPVNSRDFTEGRSDKHCYPTLPSAIAHNAPHTSVKHDPKWTILAGDSPQPFRNTKIMVPNPRLLSVIILGQNYGGRSIHRQTHNPMFLWIKLLYIFTHAHTRTHSLFISQILIPMLLTFP